MNTITFHQCKPCCFVNTVHPVTYCFVWCTFTNSWFWLLSPWQISSLHFDTKR